MLTRDLAGLQVRAQALIISHDLAPLCHCPRPPRLVPFLKRFTVFNTDQCEGLPDEALTAPPSPEGLIMPAVEALIRASGADLRLGGDRAFYAPAHDFIQVPPPEAYFVPIDWHRTALHEVGNAAMSTNGRLSVLRDRTPSDASARQGDLPADIAVLKRLVDKHAYGHAVWIDLRLHHWRCRPRLSRQDG